MAVKDGMRPMRPGEILVEELEELGLTAASFAEALDMPTDQVGGDFGRAARDNGGDRAAPLSLLWHFSRGLAESAKGVRTARRGDRVGQADRGTSAAAGARGGSARRRLIAADERLRYGRRDRRLQRTPSRRRLSCLPVLSPASFGSRLSEFWKRLSAPARRSRRTERQPFSRTSRR